MTALPFCRRSFLCLSGTSQPSGFIYRRRLLHLVPNKQKKKESIIRPDAFGKGVVPGCRFASACRTPRSKRTRFRARRGGGGWGAEGDGGGGGGQSAAVTASLYPPCHREQSSGRDPALQQERARMRREQSGVMLQATGLFDVINSPLQLAKKLGGSRSTSPLLRSSCGG